MAALITTKETQKVMNREILFRAWADGKMIFLKPFTLVPLNESTCGSLTYMQFSGLHDKNGVKIFEGDVVLLHNQSAATKEEYWFPVYKIEWYKLGFKCTHIGGGKAIDGIDFTFRNYPNTLEVIGNVFQNPELL